MISPLLLFQLFRPSSSSSFDLLPSLFRFPSFSHQCLTPLCLGSTHLPSTPSPTFPPSSLSFVFRPIVSCLSLCNPEPSYHATQHTTRPSFPSFDFLSLHDALCNLETAVLASGTAPSFSHQTSAFFLEPSLFFSSIVLFCVFHFPFGLPFKKKEPQISLWGASSSEAFLCQAPPLSLRALGTRRLQPPQCHFSTAKARSKEHKTSDLGHNHKHNHKLKATTATRARWPSNNNITKNLPPSTSLLRKKQRKKHRARHLLLKNVERWCTNSTGML